MDREHFDGLIGDLSLTADLRLLEFARRDQNRFLGLLEKMIETAIEYGISERNLHLQVNNAADNVPRLGHCRMPDCVRDRLKGKSFEISWGPNIGRPAGYYISIPEYDGGHVIRMEDAENALGGKAQVGM